MLGEAVPRFIENLRDDLASDDPAKTRYLEARARRMQTSSQLELLRLKEAQGKLMSRRSVTDTVTTLVSATRNHMLALPTRCGHLLIGLTTFQQAYEVLDRYVRLGLTELSQFSIEEYIAESRRKLPAATETPSKNGETESD